MVENELSAWCQDHGVSLSALQAARGLTPAMIDAGREVYDRERDWDSDYLTAQLLVQVWAAMEQARIPAPREPPASE